jgi:hypothetical protein
VVGVVSVFDLCGFPGRNSAFKSVVLAEMVTFAKVPYAGLPRASGPLANADPTARVCGKQFQVFLLCVFVDNAQVVDPVVPRHAIYMVNLIPFWDFAVGGSVNYPVSVFNATIQTHLDVTILSDVTRLFARVKIIELRSTPW